MLTPPNGSVDPAPQRIKAGSEETADGSRLAAQVIEKTYLRESLAALKVSVRSQLSAPAAPMDAGDQLPTKIVEGWQSSVESNFNVDQMLKDMQSALAAGMSKEELTQLLAQIGSPLGQKIAMAERPKQHQGQADPATDATRLEAAAKAVEGNSDRYHAIGSVMFASGGLKSATDGYINVSLGATLAMVALAPEGQTSVSPEEILSSFGSNRRAIEDSLMRQVVATYADTYASLSNSELLEYEAFLQTPVGKKYISIQTLALNEALLAQMYAVGTSAAKTFKEQGT